MLRNLMLRNKASMKGSLFLHFSKLVNYEFGNLLKGLIPEQLIPYSISWDYL